MDDPIMLGIIAVAVLAVLGAVFLKNKQKASAGKKGKNRAAHAAAAMHTRMMKTTIRPNPKNTKIGTQSPPPMW